MPALHRHHPRMKLRAGFAGGGLLTGALLVFGSHFRKHHTEHTAQSHRAVDRLQARLRVCRCGVITGSSE